jgi:hypothetical protein
MQNLTYGAFTQFPDCRPCGLATVATNPRTRGWVILQPSLVGVTLHPAERTRERRSS